MRFASPAFLSAAAIVFAAPIPAQQEVCLSVHQQQAFIQAAGLDVLGHPSRVTACVAGQWIAVWPQPGTSDADVSTAHEQAFQNAGFTTQRVSPTDPSTLLLEVGFTDPFGAVVRPWLIPPDPTPTGFQLATQAVALAPPGNPDTFSTGVRVVLRQGRHRAARGCWRAGPPAIAPRRHASRRT